MNIIFFIKSATISLNNYTIKDIPGSSGRLDVISRCILAALLNRGKFEKSVKVWVFLDNYKSYIFDPQSFIYDNFPKNEIRFTDYFVDIILNRNRNEENVNNPLRFAKISKISIIEAITKFQKMNYNLFILKEDGDDFFRLRNDIGVRSNLIFIIGSQDDNFLDSEELSILNIRRISIGTHSYLASSVIRLLKLHLLVL
ncbi:MAG: hypothetical protein ACFE8B_00885 [Candidatus Hermodarchaeota archaeon]